MPENWGKKRYYTCFLKDLFLIDQSNSTENSKYYKLFENKTKYPPQEKIWYGGAKNLMFARN